MEYRCLIVGDPIVEPGALLRRLLFLDFPRKEERRLKRQSLRDMREIETQLLTAPENVDDAFSITGSSLHRQHSHRAMCVSMPSPTECTMRIPNPSIPAVDITIRFQVVTEPRDLLRVLGVAPAQATDGSPALGAYGAPPLAPAPTHPGMMPHTVVAVFNPFARRSFSKMRVEWRHFLGAINDAKETHQQQQQQHQQSQGSSSGHITRANTTYAGGSYGGQPAVHFTDLRAQPPGSLALTTSGVRMGFTMMDSADTPMSPLSPYGRGASVVYESLSDPSSAPAILLVGTRFELMREAIEATPSVSLPKPSEVAELAAALGAKAYAEVGTYWDDVLDELRLTIARACVGELTHSATVRLPTVLAARQLSVARSVEEALAVAHAESTQLDVADADEDVEDGAAAGGSGGDDVDVDIDAETSDHDDKKHVTNEELTSAHLSSNTAPPPAPPLPQSTEPDAASSAKPAVSRKSIKSQWTWRRHPETHRIFYVQRATRHSQYEKPADYDGPDPDPTDSAGAAPQSDAAPSQRAPQLPTIAGASSSLDRSPASVDTNNNNAHAAMSGTLHGTDHSELNGSVPPLPSVIRDSDDEGDVAKPTTAANVVHSPHSLVPLASDDAVLVSPPSSSSPTQGEEDRHMPPLPASSSSAAAANTADDYERDLAQQLAEKQAYAESLEREVRLLREKRHVLHLQKGQNEKLSALFARTRSEIAAKQKDLADENGTAVSALDREADTLEAGIAELMQSVPALPTDATASGTTPHRKSDNTTNARGLGAVPSFLFTPEEWATVQHATAAEKERLLLERAVQSAGEQLQRVLSGAEEMQEKARSTYVANAALTEQQRACQAEVDTLRERVAELELREAAMQEALRVVEREQLQETDAQRTRRLLAETYGYITPTSVPRLADTESRGSDVNGTSDEGPAQTVSALRAHVEDATHALYTLLQQVPHNGGDAVIRDLDPSSSSAPDLIQAANAWLDAHQPTPTAGAEQAQADAVAAALVAVGRDGFALSATWRTLRDQIGHLEHLARRLHRALEKHVKAARRTQSHNARAENTTTTTATTPESLLTQAETALRESEDHYRAALFPILRDGKALMDELEAAALRAVCTLDDKTQRPTDEKTMKAFMRDCWWQLLSRCADLAFRASLRGDTDDAYDAVAAVGDSCGAVSGNANGNHPPEWCALLLAKTAALPSGDSDFCQALQSRVTRARTDTSTET